MLYKMVFLTYEFSDKTDLEFEEEQAILLDNVPGTHKYFTTAAFWNEAENKQQYELEHHVHFEMNSDNNAVDFVKQTIIPIIGKRFPDLDVFAVLNAQDEIILTEENIA